MWGSRQLPRQIAPPSPQTLTWIFLCQPSHRRPHTRAHSTSALFNHNQQTGTSFPASPVKRSSRLPSKPQTWVGTYTARFRMARRLWVAAARAWTEYGATLAQTAIAWTRTDSFSAAPKKKMEKMALGDFLADQCTHNPTYSQTELQLDGNLQ
jgi:hypothetical protein